MRQSIAPAFIAAATVVRGYTVVEHDNFLNKNMDPIKFPGKYVSHMHSFFGSDGVTVDLPTSAELQAGCYSGDNPNDLSVYWMPTLYHVEGDTYTPVPINRFSTYYENAGDAEIPFPQDMYAVAGDAAGTSQADIDYDNNGMSWWCENDPAEDKEGGLFPTTTCSTHMQTILRFPDCVNPDDLTQAAVYSPCPAGMKRIPQLRFSVRYDLRDILPDGWSGTPPLQLACSDEVGAGYCFHGDFINGWFEDAAESMLTVASDKREFAFVGGSHGDAAAPSSCKPTDSDPNGGTSDYLESLTMMDGGSSSASNTTSAAAAPAPSVSAVADAPEADAAPADANACGRQSFAERRHARVVRKSA